MLLEELKRDTPDFGGCSSLVGSVVCVFALLFAVFFCWIGLGLGFFLGKAYLLCF